MSLGAVRRRILVGSNTALWYITAVVLIAAVNDGWSGSPAPLLHQLFVLPFTLVFAFSLARLLLPEVQTGEVGGREGISALRVCFWTCVTFEVASLCSFVYESHHFARFGYGFGAVLFVCVLVAVAAATAWLLRRRSGPAALAGVLLAYGAGLLFAIRSFPLNYLRSDMLPVIQWSDQRLLRGLSPYGTIHIGSRLYDFPYLPGMLVAYLPAVALRVDERFVNLACVIALAVLFFRAARPERRIEGAALLGIFLLSPFLQYRHELYLAPHWFALGASFVLMQRRHYAWAAAVFGVSMAIYQLSWVLFPFFVLHALRRRGRLEAAKLALIGLTGMFAMIGPFLASAAKRISSNTVEQWSRLPHALANPINLSYWVTFLVRPNRLKWVQLAVMSAIFFFCLVRGRCATLTDTLRWMSTALALFIALNVLVDGYFYLTLLLVLLSYTYGATGIWREPAAWADSPIELSPKPGI